MANRGLQTLLLCIVTPISTMRTCEKSMYTTRIRLAGSIIPGLKCQNGEKVWSLQVSSSSLPFSSPLLPVGEKKKFILTNPALPLTSVSGRDLHHLTVVEIIYIVFSFGFILDEFAASKEHGWAGTFWLGYLIHESVGSRLINQMCKQSMLQM